MAFNHRNHSAVRNVFVDNMSSGNLQVSTRGHSDNYRGHSDNYRGHSDNYRGRSRDDNYRGGKGSRLPDGHWRGGSFRGRGGHRYPPSSRFDDAHDRRGDRGDRGDRSTNRMDQWRGGRGSRRPRGAFKTRGPRPANFEATITGWQKIVIVDAGHHDPAKVMEELQSAAGDSFDYDLLACEGSNVSFYLEDNTLTARTLVALSKRFAMPEHSQRLVITKEAKSPPFPPSTVENLAKVKQVMAQRYNSHMKRLDLSQFHRDTNLKSISLLFPLYCYTNLTSIGRLIAENIIDVTEIDLSRNKLASIEFIAASLLKCKHLTRLNLSNNKIMIKDKLSKLKGLEIVELNLSGNPFLIKFKKTPELYYSEMRAIFPKLVLLDGKELPKIIGFDVEESSKVVELPPVKPSFTVSEEVKPRMVQFLMEYFTELDSPDLSRLAAAYCQDAIFSMSVVGDPYNDHTSERLPNRNLKSVMEAEERIKLMHCDRDNIIKTLKKIYAGGVEHDRNSFVMDIPLVVPSKLTKVVLSGVFRMFSQNAAKKQVKFFQKTLIVVPQDAGFCIANEETYICPATPQQTKDSFRVLPESGGSTAIAPPPPAGGLEPLQLQMIAEFSKHTNMKPEFCKECLENSGWDFNKAGQLFIAFKNDGKIPQEYFIKME